jgi:peptidyl-prolyl cis-trans isomerase B (cyclophilin B)
VKRLVLLPLLLVLALLAGCGGDGGNESAATTEATETTTTTEAAGGDCETVEAPASEQRTGTKPGEKLDASKAYTLTMDTNCGSFTITLDVEQSPNTVASLVALARDGYFDHTVFHRIVPGFVIQGGDPTATGTGGPGYSTVDAPPPSARYTHGVVAMAKTGAEPAGTAGSQFFVVTGDDVGLPPDYAIVGEVTKGLDVVDRIGALGDASEQPTQVVEIEKATVEVS